MIKNNKTPFLKQMNKKIIVLCGAVLLLILIIGCTGLTCDDPICQDIEDITKMDTQCPPNCNIKNCDFDGDGIVNPKEKLLCEQTTKPSCGDGTCDNGEDFITCVYDCADPIRPPQSPVIKSVLVEGKPIPIRSNGDLWYSTWGNRGTLYMSWGDGSGLPSAQKSKPILYDLGITRTSLSPPNFSGTNVYTDDIQEWDYTKIDDDKPASLLYLDGKLYGHFHSKRFISRETFSLTESDVGYIAVSIDDGESWTKHIDNSPWTKKDNSKFRSMFFINMGQNYGLNQDGYVYAFGMGKEWEWNGPLYLTRVRKENILDYTSYEYFNGMKKGQPQWSLSQNDATPIHEDLIVDAQISSMYHEGIGRYLILSSTSVYDAPNPWGPWTYAGKWIEKDWFGYMPGIIPANTGTKDFWFTISGQPELGFDIDYNLNFGKITMEINVPEFCGDGICNEHRDTCPLDCNHFGTPNYCGTEIPYSPVINSVSLESMTPTYVTNYSEGDIWRMTVAKDGSTYTAWGDGGGFSNKPFVIPHDVKTHPNFYYLGVGKLTGTFPNNITGENLYVSDTWVGPNDDKPYSLLAIEDTLYLTACKINADAFCYLGYSTDGGNTFTMNKDTVDQTPEFEFINMGQNYELNTDGYVYVSTVNVGNQIRGALYLARIPIKQILNVSAYEYYSSENSNNPTWNAKSSNAKPILPAGGVYNVMNGITYHSGTQRFILMTEINVYDAPNPWGPWTCAGTWLTPETSESWQGGYYPYVVPIESEENSFYFTYAGQGDPWGNYMKYRFNLGKITMEMK